MILAWSLDGYWSVLLWKNLNFQFPDNLQSWETFEAQTVESHKQLDAADQEFASIKKIFDLTNGPADFNKRMKTAANFRNVIEGLFNAVNDCNNIIQQNLPEDKKKEMTDQVGLIRTQSSRSQSSKG